MRVLLPYFPSSKSEKPRRCAYSVVFDSSLAETLKALEKRFLSLGIKPVRLIDPECYTLESLADSLYGSEHIGILEVKGELNRVFYLFSEKSELEDDLEFDVFTEAKSYWDYLLSLILTTVLVLLMVLLISYPFSILPFKGVKPVERKKENYTKNPALSVGIAKKNEIRRLAPKLFVCFC
ncbi:hypothetical protein NF865_09860 [Thermococcus aggregans]|uniref:Uncharacterized protein n=1 Tax=Thermococcus aggregans TaxID=110163 RepID=A0A9E7SNQ4_THEAG|nr:hypothetical protein [Thermococcus aggregans]USS40584.1 hypothetical protein NF865_09860 [Thermococcus aggregans]